MEGKGTPQQAPINKGVGIAVDRNGGVFCAVTLIAEDHGLAGIEGGGALQDGVVAVELADRYAAGPSHGVERVAGPGGVDLVGEAEDQRLPHHQSVGGKKPVFAGDPLRRQPGSLGDSIQSVACLYDIDLHGSLPSDQGDVI